MLTPVLAALLALSTGVGGGAADGEVPDPLVGLEEALADHQAEALWAWNAQVAENERIAAEQAAAEAAAAEQALIDQAAAEQAAADQAAIEATSYSAPATYGSGACGGSLPPCEVMLCESGGDITAQNPTSSASGKWQVIDSTWNGYGGYPTAASAPESVQDQFAAELYAGGAGRGHWAC